MSLPYLQPYFGLSNSLQTAQAAAGGAGGIGGWVELARTTLGSAGDSIAVSSLADKRYYMVLTSKVGTANSGCWLQLNSDTGSNYAYRSSNNGGADGTGVSQTNGGAGTSATGNPAFGVRYISNLASKEKLVISNFIEQNTAGAGTSPNRRELVCKWANTSNAVSTITELNIDSGNYSTGSEVVVLGWDPADTHTSNFWEELASVDLSGGAATSLSTGTFTAKKYLWVQYYVDTTTSAANIEMQVGNTTIDTGSNYARRASENGGADGTATSDTKLNQIVAGGTTPIFANMFIVNNAANEKLAICHSIDQNTAGAGTAPNREEDVGKWADTTNQIDIIQISATAGNMGTNTIMKVYGSD